MKNSEIKNSNDLLGFLIQIKDNNNNCDLGIVLSAMGTDKNLDLLNLMNELSANGFIKQIDTCTVHIYEKGMTSYISPQKKIWNNIKMPLSYVFTYIMGILSTVIAQLILNAIASNTIP